jgi:hypothetical protein
MDGQKRCATKTPTGGCKNWAVGGEFCRLHDPDLAAVRRASGAKRKLRFEAPRPVEIAGELWDRKKVPTLAYIINRLLDIADAAEACKLPGEAAGLGVAVKALSVVRQCLEDEHVRRSQGVPGPGVTPAAAVPSWARPKTGTDG